MTPEEREILNKQKDKKRKFRRNMMKGQKC